MSLKKREALKNQTHTRKASLRKSSDLPDGELSFVMVSDANSGQRYDWSSGKTYEEFLDVRGANSGQLNTFFKNHSHDVDSAVGKVSNVRVENNILVGDVKFASDETSQAVYRKYVDGVLTDVSIGYEIKDYTVQERENENDLVTVTNYEIFELSAVGIGFDSGAKTREKENIVMTEEQLKRLKALEDMQERDKKQALELRTLQDAKHDADLLAKDEKIRALEANQMEMERKTEITAIATTRGMDDAFTKPFLDDTSKTILDFREAIVAKMEKDVPNTVDVNTAGERHAQDFEDALVLRMGGKVDDAERSVIQLSRASLTDMARLSLGATDMFDRAEIAERSMLVGEFPLLLLGAGNRTLEQEFDAQPLNYKQWVKEVDLPDFRVAKDLTRGHGGRLDKIGENGDLKERKIVEGGEQWKLGSFGNKFALTREMMVNDDLGAFTDLVTELAESSALTANGTSYDILRGVDNYKMADGSGLYVTARNNFTSTALTTEALQAGFIKMSAHLGMDKKTKLNIVPKFLHVSMSEYFIAKQIINSTATLEDNKNAGVANTMQNMLTVIVDSELAAGEWFLTADRRTIKVGYLAGTGRRPQIKKNDSSIMRVEFEGVFDFGVMAEDYRGLFNGNKA